MLRRGKALARPVSLLLVPAFLALSIIFVCSAPGEQVSAGGWTAQAGEVKAFRSGNLSFAVSDSPTQMPNLRALSLDTAGTEVTEGAIFWVREEVQNGGLGPAGPSNIKLYLSVDNDFDVGDDFYLGEKPVGSLAPGASEWVQWDFFMPDLKNGNYGVWVVAIVDSRGEVAESDESNTFKSMDAAFTARDPAGVPVIRIVPEQVTITSRPTPSYSDESADRLGSSDQTILLRSGKIDTKAEPQVDDPDVRTFKEVGGSHLLAQFDRIPTSEDQDRLASSGLKLLRFVANRAYWCHLSTEPKAELADACRLAGLRWFRESSAIHKLAPEVAGRPFPDYARQAGGRLLVNVLIFRDVSATDAERSFRALGAEVVAWETSTLSLVAVEEKDLSQLASLDEVEWVEPACPPKTEMNATSAQRIHADEVRSLPYYADGTGVLIGVWDSGRVGTHSDLGNRVTAIDSEAPISEHTTHVAGTIGGSGAGNPAATGMAPNVNIRSYDWNFDLKEMREAARTGVRLSNNSYGVQIGWYQVPGVGWQDAGSQSFGLYSSTTSEWDQVVYDTGLIVFIAAGNDRDDGPDWPIGPRIDGPFDTIGTVASGKNVITIGASTDSDEMTSYSSWGPTNDGRVKPDLIANGDGLLSTLPDNTYASFSGTSMATPGAVGASALLHELHTQNFLGNLRADTCKALLIHGAADLGRAGPDYEYGWGLLDTKASANLLVRGQFRVGSVAQDRQRNYQFELPPGIGMLKATLVWTDPPGSPASSVALVNNLDLVVTGPGGLTYHPWVLNPALPAADATQAINDVDNVEQVVLASPPSGVWTVSVQGTTLPAGDQEFALVCEYLPGARGETTFTIYNAGGADLHVTGITTQNGAAWLSGWVPTAPFVVSPGNSRVVTLDIQPENVIPGQSQERLLIHSNDPDRNPYPTGVYVVSPCPGYPSRPLVPCRSGRPNGKLRREPLRGRETLGR